jgi:hypothetical protein
MTSEVSGEVARFKVPVSSALIPLSVSKLWEEKKSLESMKAFGNQWDFKKAMKAHEKLRQSS